MEHPLLFTTDMVKAILDDRKTHTRRVPVERYRNWKVGDTIWVRETWRCTGGGDLRNIIYRAEGDSALSFCGIDDGRVEILHVPEPHWAEWDRLVYETNKGCDWRPSIHMPRWAARIFLKITGLMHEKVQDISEEGSIAEGIITGSSAMGHVFTAKEYFEGLWDSINAKRHNGIYAWSKNPITKVIEFKRI